MIHPGHGPATVRERKAPVDRWMRTLRRWRWAWAGLAGLVALLSVLLSFVIGQAFSGRPQVPPEIRAGDLTLSGADFLPGQSQGPLSKAAGLELTLSGTAVYTSPVLTAPIPFSDLGTIWEADLPPGTSLLLQVRTSPEESGEAWSPWQTIVEEDDAPPMPLGQHTGKLLFIPQRDGVHRRLQFRLLFSSFQPEALPKLNRLTFTFIDARAGPSTQEIMRVKGTGKGILAVEKPPVISRVEWGCPEGEGSPRWPPEYARVTHVIVHHTATPNDDTDWAARVRSIWYYHANTRGWGDIGYNFLVDPLGNVYEGRAGGDDVIGGHARSYNPGTMGVGCLGTYSVAPVPAPLQQSLEALIAWKASQRGIDPLGRSFNNHKVYDHIAGHRDVGETTCPGDVLYGLLPTVRQNVQQRLQAQEEAVTVDDLSPEFTRSPAYWHDGCSPDGHSFWTHTVTRAEESTNWAIWRPDLPRAGWYEVFVRVPSCTEEGLPEYTESARYRLYYRDGGILVTVNQRAEQGRWVSLGTYPFYRGTSGYLYLDDLAGDYWRALWYDAARWILRSPISEPPPAPQLGSPEDAAWLRSREVTLSWTVPATVDGFRLVVALDPNLTSPLLQEDVGLALTYSLSLDRDYPALYWSVQAYTEGGDGPPAPVRRFGVDTGPPSSAVIGLYRAVTGLYFLRWGGTDEGSGIASYTVQARDGTEGPWQDLWRDTTWTAGPVELPPGITRYFRVQARDRLGNEEPPHGGDGDLSSEQVTRLDYAFFQALLLRGFLPPTPLPTPTPQATAIPTAMPTTAPTPSPFPTKAPFPTVVLTPIPVPSSTPTPPPTTPTRLPSPTPPQTPGAASLLPDLRVESVRSSQGTPFDCGQPSGIAVRVSNMGSAPAGTFYLALAGPGLEDCRWRLDGLDPGAWVEVVCPAVVLNTVVTATVDVENTVVESDETNNALSVLLSVLVLPTCTPAPAP